MNTSAWIFGLAALLVAAVTTADAAGKAETKLYVSPAGNDAWSGRLSAPNTAKSDGPLASLEKARDAVRALRRAGKTTGPVTILLRGGTYTLAKPLTLAPQDSGSPDALLTFAAYPNERPVISGGVPVAGWKRLEGDLWTAPAPPAALKPDGLRQLFVNGQRRNRARWPATGMFPLAGGATPEDRAFLYRPEDIPDSLRDARGLEIVVLQYWMAARLPVARIDAATHIVTCTGGSWRPLTWSRGYYVDNAREGLTAPGSWYCDPATNIITYHALPGEDLSRAEVIAPTVSQLVLLESDGPSGVRNVTFRDLALRHTSWIIPPTGHAYPQADLPATPAIAATHAEDCSFEGCEFSHLGGWGIALGPGCTNVRVADCRFADIGAGGVRIGEEANAATDADEARRNTVTDSTFTEGCQTYLGAPAVWIGQSSGNTVSHNEITGAWMWAISVGWNWSYMPPNRCRDNIIELNHLHHLGTGILGMHGAIYALGLQPGTVIRRNLIHDIAAPPLTGDGIILDNGSAMIVVEDNLVHHCGQEGLNFNFNCLGNVVQNNVLALNEKAAINRYGDPPTPGVVDPPNANFVYHNICLLKTDKVYLEEKWPNYLTLCDYNLYFSVTKDPIKFLSFGFEEWKTKGLDAHSVIADPLFKDPEHGDFTLSPDSPALKLGFRPLDLREVGPRPRIR